MALQRADQLLVQRGLVRSRTLAQKLIREGLVYVTTPHGVEALDKAAQKLPTDTQFELRESAEQRYVSRAGLKLEGALMALGLDVRDLRALDIGQSTGGFTDCLLRHGCATVVGVEVGHGQLDAALRGDQRVQCLENRNARELDSSWFEQMFELVVMDVSFISQTRILPRLAPVMSAGANLVSLVKPQFEVGPEGLGKGGIVRDERLFPVVRNKIEQCLQQHGLTAKHFLPSVILGGDGNREFFVHAQKCI